MKLKWNSLIVPTGKNNIEKAIKFRRLYEFPDFTFRDPRKNDVSALQYGHFEFDSYRIGTN